MTCQNIKHFYWIFNQNYNDIVSYKYVTKALYLVMQMNGHLKGIGQFNLSDNNKIWSYFVTYIEWINLFGNLITSVKERINQFN